jgi:hypothetical protein
MFHQATYCGVPSAQSANQALAMCQRKLGIRLTILFGRESAGSLKRKLAAPGPHPASTHRSPRQANLFRIKRRPHPICCALGRFGVTTLDGSHVSQSQMQVPGHTGVAGSANCGHPRLRQASWMEIGMPCCAERPQWSSAFDADAFGLASINTMSLHPVRFNRLIMSLTLCSSDSLKYMMTLIDVFASLAFS